MIPRVNGGEYRDETRFASVRSAGPPLGAHRVMKYDTIGEVHHCGDIISIEEQLRSDETPAFGKKYKSMVS